MVVSLYEFKVHKRILRISITTAWEIYWRRTLSKLFLQEIHSFQKIYFLQPFLELIRVQFQFDRKNFLRDWCVGALKKRLCHQKGMLPSLLWRLRPSGKEAKHREGVYKAFRDVLRLDVAHLEEACVDVLMLWWLRWCLQKLRRGGSQKRHSSQHLNERKISSDCGWLSKTNK